jgi:light-harvesting complex I chlorophyll a/b binding protein 1
LAGDEGFDPLGLSTGKVSGWYRNFGSGFAQISDLTWMREAELQHGRVAQLAVLGFLWPGFFGTIPGPGFEETNPLKALGEVPALSIIQLSIFFAALEFRRVAIIDEDGASHIPGDSRFGAGANPSERFVLGQKTYDPEEAARLAQCEVSHCRLAMMGFLGVLLQGIFSGESVADQLGAAFSAPDYYAKAGYFLPEGI